ncbi:maleylacetoacetate isomerase [Shewanella sp. 1_MG-2023]|uniref:maleylacetoacetate isomerase n=1 Tax=unclassified Shewanella TaxID=196818 RepID=UPI0026E382FA|nr:MULTISPECIES: maleylacetoacetate isomerase [unclassified Shewanella]MDO6611658.1 maleylacetoacetate isomerase [Shewanella sp. 7_MG-2023]MDO6771513.1 maleylacetoacetate isomerase [Shewanella sp. 2_MG-2023]MDO6793838.1 maleylacetoacetate isomerase [Shewanella sp. 1_MG-2023]
MKLYGYWRSSAAYRVRIALNLKQLTAEHVSVHLVNNGGEQHTASFERLNPQNLVPALIDIGEHGDFCITQSMAIIEYLDESYPQSPLLPERHQERAIVRAMAQTLACEVHPLDNLRVLKYLVNDMNVTEENKMVWYHHWIHLGFKALEAQLDKHAGQFCFGDSVTMADLCLIPQVYNARRFNVDMAAYPNILRIDKACTDLAAFDAASPEKQHDAT